MKESFVIYRSFYEALKDLDDTTQAHIFRAICAYSLDGSDTVFTGIAKIVWTLIKPQLESNNKKYINGHKGGRPNSQNEKPMVFENDDSKKTSGFENKKPMVFENDQNKKPNVNVNVNDNDNDNVNDNENEEKKEIENLKNFPLPQKKLSFKKFSKDQLLKEVDQNKNKTSLLTSTDFQKFVDYWTEPSASGIMRFQLEKTWDTANRLRTWEAKKLQFEPNLARGTPRGTPNKINQFD